MKSVTEPLFGTLKRAFLNKNARKFFFLSCIFGITDNYCIVEQNFSFVHKSVIEPIFSPIKGGFLNKNARHFLFLSCWFWIPANLWYYRIKFQTCTQKCNWGYKFGEFGVAPLINARNAELKKWVFFVLLLMCVDCHHQYFCTQ